MSASLNGKSVIVTGGSKGIGKGIARVFAGHNAKVLIVARAHHHHVVITGPVTGYPGWTHYGATKAGQLGFMRTACIELAKYGITVNAVMPGNIMMEGLQGLGAEYLETMAASIPLKRLGSVDDIGHAAAFLASREAGYITGQTIIVDGGQVQPESLEALASACGKSADNAPFAILWVEPAMRTAARVALPVILPRAAVLWALVRLVVASVPLATGAPFGSMPPSPIGIVLLCGLVGLVDVSVRGERILWANLGVRRRVLYAAYAAAAVPAECLLALVLR